MPDPDSYAYFGISGDFQPDAFVSRVPIEPTRTLAKHSSNPKRRIPRSTLIRYAECRAKPELIDFEMLAESIVETLHPQRAAIREAIEVCNARAVLQFVLYFPMNEEIPTPIMSFSRRVISFLDAVGATIDIDSYPGDQESEQAEDGDTSQRPC